MRVNPVLVSKFTAAPCIISQGNSHTLLRTRGNTEPPLNGEALLWKVGETVHPASVHGSPV